MSTREDLEAALQAHADKATLGVYCDYLQSIGDPRGELIAIDLRPAAMSMHSIEVRRGQLLRAWLGDDADLTFDTQCQRWYVGDPDGTYATFECGFMDLVIDDVDTDLLATPAATYLRRISARSRDLSGTVEEIAADRRPWLTVVALAHDAGSFSDALAARFVAATPHLERLALVGREIFAYGFTHPNLRELAVDHADTVAMNDYAAPPLPRLTSLDLRFGGVYRGMETVLPHRVPSLRHLDLRRDEPSTDELFDRLAPHRILGQLTRLVLPSIRSARAQRRVNAMISHMEMLRELVIARGYELHRPFNELVHPSARIVVPVPIPWRPRETYAQAVRIDGFLVELVELVDLLEAGYDALAPDLQAVWQRFWRGPSIAAAELLRALEALQLTPRLYRLWLHLRTEVTQRGNYLASIGDA